VFFHIWSLLRQFPKLYEDDNEKKENEELYINDFLSTLYISAKASGINLINNVYLLFFASYNRHWNT